MSAEQDKRCFEAAYGGIDAQFCISSPSLLDGATVIH